MRNSKIVILSIAAVVIFMVTTFANKDVTLFVFTRVKSIADQKKELLSNMLPLLTNQLNEKAPYMIDPSLRFDEAVADVDALNITYLNTFVSLSADDSDFKFVDEHLPDAIDYLCNDEDIRKLIAYGVSYTYIYRDRHGEPVRTFIYSENTCSQLSGS